MITETEEGEFMITCDTLGRHHGKIIAVCPTQNLAQIVDCLIKNHCLLCWDCAFEVHEHTGGPML